jgi:hypothetical protein
LIQNELWVPKCCHAHSNFFFLCLGFPKNVIKISVYYTPIIFVIHHFFGWKMVKNDSLVVCFHPFQNFLIIPFVLQTNSNHVICFNVNDYILKIIQPKIKILCQQILPFKQHIWKTH